MSSEVQTCELTNPLILEMIFSMLSPADIKTAALVSRTWNSVAGAAKFWTWVRVTLTKENFSEIFFSSRFQSISNVDFKRREGGLSDSQLETFFSDLHHSALKKVNACWTRLPMVDPDNLAQHTVKLEWALYVTSDLTPDQVNAMIKAIAECEDLKLEYLNICVNNLSSVPPHLLARAVIRLYEADMFHTKLTGGQVEVLLDTIIQASARGELTLRRLNIRRADISTVSSSVAQKVKRILSLFIYQ